MTRKIILLFLILAAVSACQPEQSVLPTRARLATATDAPAPTEVGQTVFDPTATATDTAIPTETPTATEALSGTASATITPTITYTPSSTITVTPSQTYTPAPTIGPDERPLVALAFTALAATVLPTDYVLPGFEGTNIALTPTEGAAVIVPETGATLPPVTNCPNFPSGGFGSVYQGDASLAAQLGCPLSSNTQQIPAAQQRFQRGTMLWLNGEIAVLYDLNSALETYADTFTDGVDPETSGETAPAGLYAPIRGFLKVWSSQPNVRNGLGWATAPEQGATATVLNFDNGRMIWLAGTNQIYALFNGSWRSFAGTF
ncbi:MAG: hypothetical protein KC496_20730 [Anaerolineae bacterium]|nr:hypothetical protein [Anaerolineae bacterium]